MKIKQPNFSAAAVCERAKARRAVLASVVNGPGPDEWKLEQVRLFIEEADGDAPVGGLLEAIETEQLRSQPYIWDGAYLLDAATNCRVGYVEHWADNEQGRVYAAYEYVAPPKRKRLVRTGSLNACQTALEKRHREAHQ